MHIYLYIENGGDLRSGLQYHLSAFIPFHPTVWTYWNYFSFLDANAPSLSFPPGLCRIAFPAFRTLCCSSIHTVLSSLAQSSRSVFSTPEILSWPLKSGLGSPSVCSYSTAYLCIPVMTCCCVCVCDLFFLWEETVCGFLQHQVWQPLSKMAAMESSLPSSACHTPMERWSLFFHSPWIQIGFSDSLWPIKRSRSSSGSSKAFTWVS